MAMGMMEEENKCEHHVADQRQCRHAYGPVFNIHLGGNVSGWSFSSARRTVDVCVPSRADL